jgi:single-strand DNA-binding protein
MKSLNRIEVIGNVGQDPTVRQAGQSTVAEFSVATTEKWTNGERTEWHRVQAWGKLAEIVEQYVRKGDRVFVAGSMKYESYTDKQGVEKTLAKINARELLMLGSKKGASPDEQQFPPKPTNLDLSQPNDDLPF